MMLSTVKMTVVMQTTFKLSVFNKL